MGEGVRFVVRARRMCGVTRLFPCPNSEDAGHSAISDIAAVGAGGSAVDGRVGDLVT